LDPHDTVDRGYRSHVLVEIATSLYPVFFYDCGRLQCELQEMAKHGRPFIAETGMIVLESVTLAAMELAVQKLYEEGYFDYFKSIDQNRLAAANPYAWPP